MGEIIDLTKYLKKKEEKELDELSSRLASLIEDLGITEDFEMYMEGLDDVYGGAGMPYVYTMSAPYSSAYSNPESVTTLSDITDVLTKLTLQLDEMGYTKWADQISNVVGEMFVSGTFNHGELNDSR